MRNLSSFKGEEAVEVIANLVEPSAVIIGDSKVRELVAQEDGRVKAVKHALKHHKKEVLQIMAILEGVDVDNETDFRRYVESVNFFTLPKNLLAIFNDPDVQELFLSQETKPDVMPSTPASEESRQNG